MDRELGLRIFSEEAVELLAEMEGALLQIEASPASARDAVAALFRAVHTIKGSAGMVGLEDVEGFAHRVEEVLEGVRGGEAELAPGLLELMLRSHDVIASYVKGAVDVEAREAVLSGLSDYAGPEGPGQASEKEGQGPSSPRPVPEGGGSVYHISLRFDRDVLRKGLDPLSFISYLSRLGEIVSMTPLFDSMPGPEDMDPESCYLGMELDLKSGCSTADIEEVFEFIRDDCSLRIVPPGSPAVTEAADPSAPADVQTVRLDTRKLDLLVEAVGELVISGSAVLGQAERVKDEAMLSAASILQKIVEVVRDGAMGLRMVPLSETFGRYYRVVRDIAQEGGKDIRLEIKGGDTELDRKMVESIRDPLTHLVRNAAGHGIEGARERLAAGKPRQGLIRLRAFHEAGEVVIEVSDDGRGVEMDRAHEYALKEGLIATGSELTPEALSDVLMSPGFSTANEITTVSGRGVGLDVVRIDIEKQRGKVFISSEKGYGTTVRLSLPLTLAIMDGFLVTASGRSFVVHMDSVLECLELPEGHSSGNVRRTREHIEVRGSALPYIRVRDVLEIEGSPPGLEHVLIVRHGGNMVGLVVDELIGEVQTVIKPLGRFYGKIKGVSGATIQGDGSLALILDVPGLVALALAGGSGGRNGPV
jgi:two-component system chemotaxis sensor kinase CheA